MDERFSVLMSLYIKERPEYVKECFESLLRQTVKASEWLIVEDGPLTPELYSVLDEYETKFPGLIKRVPLEKNRGLGLALREGITHCTYELIARMDTDDISREDRFERQLEMFSAMPELDICGSHIKEFEGSPDNVISKRNVPIDESEIYRYQKRRDSFNHMTVMYKKSAVLKAGNYKDALKMEDSLLWVNMMLSGAKCANADDYLVYVRTGQAMIDRRGGYNYYKDYRSGRKKIYETGYISWWDYFSTLAVQFVVAMMPRPLRRFVFLKMLRR